MCGQLQKNVVINNIIIPIIQKDNTLYYPITYTYNKLLLKSATVSQLIKNGYSQYIEKFIIEFGEKNVQETYCITEEGLKQTLSNINVNRLNNEQKKAMIILCEHLGIKREINIAARFIEIENYDGWKAYDDFWIKECIESFLKNEKMKIWQLCNECKLYLPYHQKFFRVEPRGKDGKLKTVCKNCNIHDQYKITHEDIELEKIYNRYGQETYEIFKTKDVIKIWIWWKNQKSKSTSKPSILLDKENVILILKYLYEKKLFKDCNVNCEDIYKLTKINIHSIRLTTKTIYKEVLNIEPIGYIDNLQSAKKIFFNYLNRHSLIVDENNLYTFDYGSTVKDCGLLNFVKKYYQNDMLKFILKLFDNKPIPYKFKGGYINYWKSKENRVYALKCLIEQDFKLQKEKIPLYLTLFNIQKKSRTMRNVLRNYYKNDIWSWINELYPGEFEEQDFNIGKIRIIFDSLEESEIHDYLTNKFKNVIYNQRNSDNTINILGMMPDWFVFTDNGVWAIEYFGLCVINRNNTRTNAYKERVEEKLEKYKSLHWLGKVYIYPDDLKEEYKGMKEKLSVIN